MHKLAGSLLPLMLLSGNPVLAAGASANDMTLFGKDPGDGRAFA